MEKRYGNILKSQLRVNVVNIMTKVTKREETNRLSIGNEAE